MKIFLHAGAPRTATTILQKEVFPRLTAFHYAGKNFDNRIWRGRFRATHEVRAACERHRAGDPAGLQAIRALIPAILASLSAANGCKDANARDLAGLLANCIATVARALDDKPVFYSDESLVESGSGLSAKLDMGDAVVLEQLRDIGFLEHVSLSVVLREPGEFLKASYYKTMEFALPAGDPPLSFDDYLARQLAIHERSPSASRIFLCMHRTAARHFRALCPVTVVTEYRDLVSADHVVDTLLGVATGEAPFSLARLPTENRSWRQAKTNQFILGAAGVPPNITIEEYALTFPEALRRHSLDRLFADEALQPGHT